MESNGVVVDIGSDTCKAGFSGKELPEAVIPTVVGRPIYKSPLEANLQSEYYIGQDAINRRTSLHLRRPIQNSVVLSWDDTEKILHHIFYNELKVSPEEKAIFLTETHWGPKNTRESFCELIFEKFRAPAFYIAHTSVLSVYAQGLTTAMSVTCGKASAYSVPVYEGYALPHACQRSFVTGYVLDDYLYSLLRNHANVDQYIIRDIKHKFCFVPKESQEILESISNLHISEPNNTAISEDSYELPDGKVIEISKACMESPIAFFDPYRVVQHEEQGIHQHVYTSAMKCEPDIRGDLFANIVVSGGCALIPNFAERLESEVSKLASNNQKVKTIKPENPILAPWIGGSMLSSLSSFQNMWVSRADFDEKGPACVHQKCF